VTNVANDGTKGGASPKLSQAQGLSRARLQKVEHEIRRIGILVSSDPVKHELFTFFRKADIQRDGKAIFSRLVAVLRSNVCTISDKKAAKASDMLLPENGRLHRLFMAALTPSIRSVIANLKGLLPCGMASFIAQSPRVETSERWRIESNEANEFHLLDMDAQLVASGHLVLSFRQRNSVHLSQPIIQEKNAKVKPPAPDEGYGGTVDRMLVLAPSGRLAKPVHGQSSSQVRQQSNIENSSLRSPLHFESIKQQIWEAMVKNWLANQGIELQPLDQEQWLDVELPVQAAAQSPVPPASPTATHSESLITWWSFRWPASLCFELRGTKTFMATTPIKDTEMEDPLSFAEEWYLGAEARAKILEERRISRLTTAEVGNQQSEAEAILQNPLFASSPTFHRHAMGDLSMTNNIYPTPPDGPVSQVTPGMSSMDGVVVTPADQNQQLPEAIHKRDDEEMHDAVDVEESDLAIGTGQYDEDLFGDIPVETFGPSGIADEPNWDFFDEPDLEIATDDLGGVEPTEMEHNQNVGVGGSDNPVLFPNEHDAGNPSRILEDREEADEGMIMEDDAPDLRTKGDLDSATPWAHHSRTGDQQVYSVESTIPDPRKYPLTASETRHIVADTILFSHHIPKDPAKCTSPPTREMHQDDMVEVVHTGRGLRLSDNKYSANGRFWFGNEDGSFKEEPKLYAGVEIPRIGLHPFGSSSEMPQQRSGEFADRMVRDTTQSESLSSTEQSDFDSSDFFLNMNEPGTPSADANREWTRYAPASPERPETHCDPPDEQQIRNEFDQLLEHLRIDDSKATRSVYERREPEPVATSAKSATDIMTAQFLVDQLTQSSMQHIVFSAQEAEDVPLLNYDVARELAEVYGTAEQANLHQLVRISCADTDDTERILKLADTNISIFREGKRLTALPTILSFWDALGLQPAHGRKNITALCIHPHGSSVSDGCRVFIERLGETYESCNLGDHKIGDITGTTNGGLVGWSDTDMSVPDLSQTCERVGAALSQLPASDHNIMIYMILPPGPPSQILMVCEGFLTLWSTYVKTCGKKQPNELAMQLIPMSFVAQPDTLAIPSQQEYTTLAIEVYNRCPPASVGDEIARCGSAIVLAERLSVQLEFDLTTTVQSPFEKDGRALHLAYSQSKDNRWLTAAWTDKLGNTALTMSYCLRQRGSRTSRPLPEVIKDLWDVSVGLMQKSRTKWRLVVAKEGRVASTEVNEWVVLANQDVAAGQPARHTLVLLSIDPEPPLCPRLPPGTIKQVQGSAGQPPSGIYGTPASTPQASTTSPDQTAIATPTPGGTALNAATPPDHTLDPNGETDLALSDPVEATWSVILSHGTNQGDSLFEARPALASGYLLKRRGATDADHVVALEVNLLHVTVTSAPERQDLLKEILSQYKDLVTLARTRGMIDPVTCVLPWHIATAIKGQQALSLVM
jgi:mediator of RNA polymerase II transcription subunit 13